MEVATATLEVARVAIFVQAVSAVSFLLAASWLVLTVTNVTSGGTGNAKVFASRLATGNQRGWW